jgi:hypothetical protein
MRDPKSRSRIRRVIIRINSDWRIRSDPYNWIIETRRKGGVGERWNAVGHYGDLDRAVLGLVQRQIRVMAGTYHVEALAPLCRALAGLEEEISQALAGVVSRLPLKEGE